ncbi:MAG TPA: hypothetical protein VJB68_04690 [Methylophilaceae bacterium]|nr:hypothetical protein [Methylophilaceae bacterium]
MRGYPKWFYRFLVASFVLLTLSGLLLIPNALDMRLEWDMPWRLAGSQQLTIVAIHAILAFLIVSQMGALWSVHMRIGWRHHKNIKTGLSLVAILLALILTGIGIYYLGDEWSVPASAAHILIGLILPCLFGYHIVMGRSRERLR